jgi:hypothetical protein
MVRAYLVVQREGRWWIIVDGQRTGRFPNALVAEASAIASAKQDFTAGQPARVIVETEGLHTVYDSSPEGTSAAGPTLPPSR